VKSNHQKKFSLLRSQYPFFIFEKQNYSIDADGLKIQYTFNVSDRYYFYPQLFIPRKGFFLSDSFFVGKLDTIVFNIGLIELISYWKTTCSPQVFIRPYALLPEQCAWWKKLYFNGLGEFFYLNSIEADETDFMQLSSTSDTFAETFPFSLSDGAIVPVGGGKDSAVTLELLSLHTRCIPMIVNPRGASLETIFTKGYALDDFFEVRRTLDPLLLTMNDQGFLNGHTPFSALLAFLTLLASVMTGNRHIALSNESSANEATIEGTPINHQYSKSFEFESDFRDYIFRYINPEINYFSFLRPLNELQIAALFSHMAPYHTVFKSCNVGSRTDTWCGKCAKCLFTYVVLSPFLAEPELVQIFGDNLLKNADGQGLQPLFDQIAGISDEKPFDCVGTVDEVNMALCETIRKSDRRLLPDLLIRYLKTKQYRHYRGIGFWNFLNQIGRDHYLLPEFENILTSAWHAQFHSGPV